MTTSITIPKLNHERGFLPLQDPLTRLPKAFEAWEELASQLARLLASDHLRGTMADLPRFPDKAIKDSRERGARCCS